MAKPAYHGTFTGIAVLGLGVLMGEHGIRSVKVLEVFWAWDPV